MLMIEQVASTIASVRQNRQAHQDQDRSEPSFIAETSFVKAPLNSRVSSVSKGKAKQQDTLDRVPLDIQQALVLEDLLYVLTVRMIYPARKILLIIS